MKKKDIVGWAGIGVCVLSVLVALYVGLWVCIVGGVASIINGFQTDPWSATQIGFGVLRFMSAGVVGWITVVVGWFSGVSIMTAAEKMD